jgi:hypothetical protein
MTDFIIHIGPQKTGARYLQEAFARARPLLAERGILYPPIWGERAHPDLPERLSRLEPRLEKQFTELRESGYPVVLLSAEGLADLPAASVEYLRLLTRRKNPVRIVFYVRSWADLLASHWKQAVKDGGTETFREYLLGWASDPAGCSVINFAPALRHYATQFGAYAVDIVSYDTVLAERGDLFRHFAASFLDWPDAPTPDLPRVNVSPSPAEIEVVRTLHGIETARLGQPPPRPQALAMTERYLSGAVTSAAPALRQALAAYEGRALLDEADVLLAQLHRDLFNEFREAVVEPSPKGMLFQPRRAEIPYIQRDYLLAPGVVDELREIHRQLLADLERPGATGEPPRQLANA